VNLLLDTHILVWSQLVPEKLSKQAAKEIDNPANDLWVSPISLWEIAHLSEQKKIKLDLPVERWVQDMVEAMGLREAPLTTEVALQSFKLDTACKDPFRRFVAATAKVYGFTLVTADEALARLL
jgi:PIN domain nuclease of toxin-antitoxin system